MCCLLLNRKAGRDKMGTLYYLIGMHDFYKNWKKLEIQGISRVIMSTTDLKLQPTIHLESKPGSFPRPYPGLLSKCILGYIFNSVRVIISYHSRNTLYVCGLA
jgi:hypothetical protein